MRTMLIGCVVCLAAACGDDSTSSGEIVDAAAGVIDAAGAGNDGGAGQDAGGSGGGTQGVGQFCETLPDGGPLCMDGLECCADKVCQVTGECGGQTGFIPCECTDDCSGGNICCESATQTFCTKRNGCTAVSGTEVTVCP